MSAEKLNKLTFIDIGTSKLSVCICTHSSDGFEVLANVKKPHRFIHQGQIVCAESLKSTLKQCIDEADAIAGGGLEHTYLSLVDGALRTQSVSKRAILRRQVTDKDLLQLQEMARDKAQIKNDRHIIYSTVLNYRVDGVKTPQPLGVYADALEIDIQFMTIAAKSVKTATNCLADVFPDLKIQRVLPSIAGSVMSTIKPEDENRLVIVADIGFEVTDFAIVRSDKIEYMKSIPIGGIHFTQDIAVGLRTPQDSAEFVKKQHGSCLPGIVDESAQISVDSFKKGETQKLSQKFLSEILQARSEELLFLLKKCIHEADLGFTADSELILTGGASQLVGLLELAQMEFDCEVSQRRPLPHKGLGKLPMGTELSSLMGLLHYARERHSFEPIEISIDTLKSKWAQLKKLIDNIL